MIKKCIKTLFLLCIGTAAFAQKPVAGNFSTEILFNFNGAPTVGLNPTPGNGATAGFKGRFFLADKTALRLAIGGSMNSNTSTFNDPSITPVIEGKNELSINNFAVQPGIEFHFTGTEKLSPYAGVVAGIGRTSTTETWTNTSNGNSVFQDYNRERTQSALTYSFSLVAGADYYLAEKVFIGAEMGLITSYITSENPKTTYSGSAAPTIPPTELTNTQGSLNITPGIVGGLRLGFVF